MEFINPKTNFAFKKIFGSSENKDILISFLNALIYDGEPTIRDVEILDPYSFPQFQELKDVCLNVKARLNNGIIVIVEIQFLSVKAFKKQPFYNAAKVYSQQLARGRNSRNLKSVINLTITNLVLFPESIRIVSHVVLKERDSDLRYIENGIELIFVELPKFLKKIEELDNLTDRWLYFMKNSRNLELSREKTRTRRMGSRDRASTPHPSRPRSDRANDRD
ncbi:MAG: Rpn family recombination-promoting nuclease/putative transposase [Cyanobacteriota bacterium]|nr:Rpn family recombination-promoting nuclease/putative transposase [Cyanobacteriota bacterium]